ncbi:MAG: exodeoxyribonuclease VII small subunit [Lachnospiraceae bacterium]|nr:exodeoxyribonuclease VII small subunit [Lachnospiraceae bacterium]
MKLEENFKALDKTLEALEDEDITLEDAFKLYKEGMDLVKACNADIDKVEKKLKVLNEDGEVTEEE